MTPDQLRRYRWIEATRPKPFKPELFPRTGGVVGEVKPHNRAGIEAGIQQLRRYREKMRRLPDSRGRRQGAMAQLITYRQVRTQPTLFEVLAADSRQVNRLLDHLGPSNSGRSLTDQWVRSLDTWYRLGLITVPEAAEPLTFWQCPAPFGTMIEARIRTQYANKIGVTLTHKRGSRAGPDLQHEREVAAFLRELATELEAELEARGGVY